ncbi:hypothetical protein CISIN_1g0204931mg, partial [Citrus sinensis]
GNSRQDKILA